MTAGSTETARRRQIFVLMGVSGSGKSTIGTLLAQRLHIPFLDADDFHPQANKDKMHAGHPLTDEDRWPWLATLNRLLRDHAAQGTGCVLACSALREVYRDKLADGLPPGTVDFVLLQGSRELIQSRLAQRRHEFMNSKLLDSQFATLETPDDAIKVTNDRSPDQVVDDILQQEHLA
ncbi:gluconokinase [Terriglobus aquaticus]|uniref:Gluconokinase n=1 Tax=Terriglobus aquaticus TaxID=940139 RepID=A0ABW9KMR5_9BACT|nr:gluconokinase [Terriglobus aquaticus]